MKLQLLAILKYIILLAIGVTLLIMAFKGQDFVRLLRDLKSANYWWVAVSAACCLFAHILRAARWNMLIAPLQKGTPALTNTFYAVMIGYLANLAFPRMGEVSRCGVINKTDKIPLNELIGTVITERLIDLVMLGVVISATILVQYDLIANFLYTNLFLKFTASFNYFSILIFATGLLALSLVVFYIVIKKSHWGLVKKITALWVGFSSGLRSVKRVQNKKLFVFYTVLIWVFYLLSTYFCLFSLNALSHLGLAAALSVLVFGSLGMIAPVQGGIGAFHWLVAEGLTIYAISRSNGLAYATIIHSSQTILILIIGLISMLMIMLHSSKKINQ